MNSKNRRTRLFSGVLTAVALAASGLALGAPSAQGAAKWIGAAVDAAGQPATAWSYSFDPGGSGPFVVTRRAVDTSGNAETVVSGSGVRFTIS